MEQEYYIGQIFDGIYPPEAAMWCNTNNAYIEYLGNTKYEIRACLPPTKEEQKANRRAAYVAEKDPITCQIVSLRDEKQTEEIIAEINELIAERAAKVEEIKARYPYPTYPII